MSTLGTKAAIAGAILCVIGLSLFAYGMSSMSSLNYGSALSSSYIVIVGVFIGMVGIFVLMMDLFGSTH